MKQIAPRSIARFLYSLALLAMICPIANAQDQNRAVPSAKKPPNIIVLYSDDAGYADFGFQPHCPDEIKKLTPQIDSIAHNGVRLTNAYMSGCVCSPSRAGLMTGRYQGRFGFDNNLPPGTQSGLALDETFGPKRLQRLGYKTGLVGKWHLGYPAAFHPLERGFDWFYGLLQGSRKYYPMENVSPHRVILDGRTPTPEQGYVTDRFGDAAVRFIDANKEKPFYLFVSFTAPHGPLQPDKKVASRIEHIKNKRRRDYMGLVVSLDDNVGKILKAVKANGIEDNTLVIFTNDNGGQTKTGANNGPLKGRKGTLWEGGTRVPWAMRWPEKIKAGSVIDDPIISLDILPTLFDINDQAVNADWNLDGRSFLPLLTGQKSALPTRTLYWRQHGSTGNISLRDGDWKLIHNREDADAKPQLYDLANDIGETKDVADSHAKLTAHLLNKLAAWESELKEPLWGANAKSKK